MGLCIERHHRQHHAGEAAQHEDDEEADQVQHRQLHLGPPVPQRAQPRKDLNRRRDRDQRRGGRKEAQRHVRDAGGEHVVHPQPEAEKGQRQYRSDDRPVSEQPGPRHHRQYRRHRTRRWQEDDIDFGMAEQPEQVLPQQRIAAQRSGVEGPAERALHLQQDRSQDQRRKAEDHHPRRRQQIPGKDRHPVQPHVAGAQLQDRHRDLDGRAHRRHLDKGDAEQPDVGIDPRCPLLARQGRVQEPARIGRHTRQHRSDDDGAAEQIAPPAQRRQTGERQIARAQHLGQDVHRQPLEHRDGEQEHHDAAVHREDLVVDGRPHERAVRRRQLRADQHRQDAADRKEGEGGDDEALADVGMVHRSEPAPPPRLGPPDGIKRPVQPQRPHRSPPIFPAVPPPAHAAQPAASWAMTVKP